MQQLRASVAGIFLKGRGAFFCPYVHVFITVVCLGSMVWVTPYFLLLEFWTKENKYLELDSYTQALERAENVHPRVIYTWVNIDDKEKERLVALKRNGSRTVMILTWEGSMPSSSCQAVAVSSSPSSLLLPGNANEQTVMQRLWQHKQAQ
jgi:hypothetical protein